MNINKKQQHTGDKGRKQHLPAATKKISSLTWISVIAISLITYIVLSPSLKCGFINWDDPDYVTENPLVVNNSVPVKEIFKTPVVLNYHPLSVLSLAWNYQLGKLDPTGYHSWNLWLHVFNTILAFIFIFLLTKRNLLMASIVALFFGIHPMHVESVAWISERKDVLYVFFLLAGLITYLRYRESKRKVWYAVTILLFILSCLSKAMAVVFPVLLLLIDYLLNEKLNRKMILDKIPFLIISMIVGVAAYKIQSGIATTGMEVFSIAERTMFASYGAILYILKLIVPYKLSIFHAYPVTNGAERMSPLFYSFPFIFLGLMAAVYFFLRKEKAIVFGLLFYLVSVALVLQFISVGEAIMADRYSYLAYIGLLFAAAYLINEVWNGKNARLASLKYPLAAILIIGAIVFSIQSYARTQVWTNSEILFTDVMKKYPDNCYLAYYNRGDYYHAVKHEDEKALHDYNKTLEMNPRCLKAYNNRGNIYLAHKQFDLALADFNKFISLEPALAAPYANRAICYHTMGDDEKAIADFSKCIQLNPLNPDAYSGRGVCFLTLKKYDEGLADFSKAIEMNPAEPKYWFNRSIVENNLGNTEAARADALKAQQLGFPVDSNYLKRLGAV